MTSGPHKLKFNRQRYPCASTNSKVCLFTAVILFGFTALFIPFRSVTSSGMRVEQSYVLVAYERIPQQYDGAELFLSTVLHELGQHVRIRFLARSVSGVCAPSAADLRGLHYALADSKHSIDKREDMSRIELSELVRKSAAVLLPVSVLEATCDNASIAAAAEEFADLARSLGKPSPRIVVFTFDAHAVRARSLAEAEDLYPAQKKRYAAAAAALEVREAELYGAADAVVALTPEDAAAIPPARGPTIVSPFLFSIPPELVTSKSSERDAAVHAAIASAPKWSARSGFLFVGSGNNPTNALSLRAFLINVWPAVHAALPKSTLRVVGRPPSNLCTRHGISCGGWADGTPFERGYGGVVEVGLVDDLAGELTSARVGIAPMTCGTGVNTKVGLMLAAGLPVVGSPKAARGYAIGRDVNTTPGVLVANSAGDWASALISLHEGEAAWSTAQLMALNHAAELGSRDQGGRAYVAVAALLEACLGNS